MMEADETTALLDSAHSGKIKPICIITGANTGLGYRAAEILASSKYDFHVILACRTMEKAIAAAQSIRQQVRGADVTPMQCDLASLASVRSFASEYLQGVGAGAALKLLVCNGGFGDFGGPRKTTADGYEEHFQVNYMSHFLLTNLLLPQLKASKGDARVVLVSSALHDPATLGGKRKPHAALDLDNLNLETRYNGELAYRNSKLAMVLFGYELQRRLAAEGVATVVVQSLHPGFVPGSEFLRRAGLVAQLFIKFAIEGCCAPCFGNITQTVDEGAECIVRCCTDPLAGPPGGRYFEYKDEKFRETFSSVESYDEGAAKKLWDKTAKMVKLGAGAKAKVDV